MTAFVQREIPVDDWNALFEAITERLLRAVEEPQLDALSPAPRPHDILNSVQTQMRECVSELRMLHSGLSDRRARGSREEKVAEAHAGLTLALADFGETTGFDLSAASRFDSTHPESLDPSSRAGAESIQLSAGIAESIRRSSASGSAGLTTW
ncbi:MAG: hypothetical protein ABI330_19525 [Caldimonas sp.]